MNNISPDFESLLHDTHNSQHLSSLLTYLQLNSFTESKKVLFASTGLDENAPYYFCHTGLQKEIYYSRLGIEGLTYSFLYHRVLHPRLVMLMKDYHFRGTPYLMVDNSKQIGILLQPTEKSSITPLAFAEKTDSLIQDIYSSAFPHGTGRYCNTTALSDPVSGLDGIYHGYCQTAQLKQLSFFHMTPGLLTKEHRESLKNQVTYRTIMGLCRSIYTNLSHGDAAHCLSDTKKLFLNLLKYSFDFDLLRDVLSYLKHALDIRLTIYQLADDIDLTRLCAPSSYSTIEECFEALVPVLESLCRTIQEFGPCSDPVAYSICYIRSHLAEDISLGDIADYADTAPSHLSNIFHQQTGMTIKQFQTQARIEAASSLLTQTDTKIAEVAALTGFSERRYFTSIFKSVKGMTPQQYRSLHQLQT